MGAGSDVYFIDDSGTPFGVKRNGNFLRVETTSRLYNIAEGNVSGYSNLYKFGYNAALTTAYQTVWSKTGIYAYLSTADQLDVSGGAQDTGSVLESGTVGSTSTTSVLVDASATFSTNLVAAGDIVLFDGTDEFGFVSAVDSETQLTLAHSVDTTPSGAYRVVESTGTGAAVVQVYGLDASYDALSEFVVMNGATDVITTAEFLRVNRAKVLHAGSDNANNGVIDITDDGTNTTRAEIRAGISQTEMCSWTVPNGKTFYMTQFNASEANNKRTRFTIYHRVPGGNVFRPTGPDIMLANGSNSIVFQIPLQFHDKEDIEIRAIGEITAGIGAASWEGWYE